jgi:hypothetical protein
MLSVVGFDVFTQLRFVSTGQTYFKLDTPYTA